MSTTERRTAGSRTTGRRGTGNHDRRPRALLLALLAAAALALPVGCAAPGELRDHGAAAPVTPPPARVPLWPGLATAPPPEPAGSAANRSPEPPPQPVPDIGVPGQDLATVDVRTLLTKDPGVSQDERRALDPCTGCEVRSPEYRDLTGDGRPELLVAVALADSVVLHVYTTAGDRLLPVLRVPLQKVFGAATVGTDLWLYESTTLSSRTSRLYHWDGTRLSLSDRKVEGIGPLPGQGPDPGATPQPDPTSPAKEPTAVRPTAVPAPAVRPPAATGPTAVPGEGPAPGTTTPRNPRPAPALTPAPTASARPETKP